MIWSTCTTCGASGPSNPCGGCSKKVVASKLVALREETVASRLAFMRDEAGATEFGGALLYWMQAIEERVALLECAGEGSK